MNLLDQLRADHRCFLGLLERLDRAVTTSSGRRDGGNPAEGRAGEAVGIVANLRARMKAHEGLEESLLFPALRRFAPEMEPALSVIEADHDGLRRAFDAFAHEARVPGRSPPWMILGVARLANMVRSHIVREEADLFAAASRRLPAAELERLGRQAEQGRAGAEAVQEGS